MVKRFCVLVVDDAVANIRLISEILKKEYDILTALNGYDAITLLKTHTPDLILLDVMMPELSGFDLCRIIRSDAAFDEVPIIFLTALESNEDQLRGLEIGAIDYLTKPVSSPLLKIRIHNHLALKERNILVKVQRDELAKQKQELENKNRELENFTYTVSHDLKSPLITIQSYAGMIRQDIEAGRLENATGDLTRIEGAAAKMTELLDDLLELSRIGRLMNPALPIDMNRLVNEALKQLAGPIQHRQTEVVVQPELPVAWGDIIRIAEVMQNLLENAIKYMGDQTAPQIEIGVRGEGRENIFFVRDNGLGIDPLYHEKVFGLFNKLDPTSVGTGVGLALVKRIIEVHGGRVWVESEGTGRGACFCFTLPSAMGTQTKV